MRSLFVYIQLTFLFHNFVFYYKLSKDIISY